MSARPVTLVTGARRGIGRAIALALARGGHDVAISDLVEDAATAQTLAALRQIGVDAVFHRNDVADISSHTALVEAVLKRFNRLDVFISNAGIGAPIRGDLLELAPENFDRVMSVNLRGAVFLCQAVANAMLSVPPQGPRSIVLITSVSAEMASTDRADYCMSKAGLAMWAKALALRLAPENISVFEVRPGIIRTDMTEVAASKYDAAIAKGLVPASRWGESDDVAHVVAGLVSGVFSFATGSVICADGGLSLPRL